MQQDKEKWLADRRKGITGSDVAAILGLNPWRTPMDVYLDKTGQANDIKESEAMYFGTLLEPLIADEYSKRFSVRVFSEPNMLTHPKYSWMLGNIDRWVEGKRRILECKTASLDYKSEWGDEGTDQIPPHYLCQVAWYVAITDVSRADIALLLSGNQFKVYTYRRDEIFEQKLIRACEIFWHENILANKKPAVTNLDDVKNLYRQDKGTSITATDEILFMLEELKIIKKNIKEQTVAVTNLQIKIQEFIGDNANLVDKNGKILASWRSSKPRITFDATTFKDEQPELYREYLKQNDSSRTFLLKETK